MARVETAVFRVDRIEFDDTDAAKVGAYRIKLYDTDNDCVFEITAFGEDSAIPRIVRRR